MNCGVMDFILSWSKRACKKGVSGIRYYLYLSTDKKQLIGIANNVQYCGRQSAKQRLFAYFFPILLSKDLLTVVITYLLVTPITGPVLWPQYRAWLPLVTSLYLLRLSQKRSENIVQVKGSFTPVSIWTITTGIVRAIIILFYGVNRNR